MTSLTFKNRTWDVAAELHVPTDFDENRKYAAIVCVHPGSSCKGQTAGLYASRLAEQGFVAIAFDASFQGESGGAPRHPATRVEDVRCAVDYLVTLPYVDEEKIGVLGVCAGGGYAVNAAMTEHRIMAVGTVDGANIGRINRQGEVIATLKAIGRQRTAEARGAELRIDNWIPNSTGVQLLRPLPHPIHRIGGKQWPADDRLPVVFQPADGPPESMKGDPHEQDMVLLLGIAGIGPILVSRMVRSVIPYLLHQLPLRPDREQDLEHAGPDQALRWDRGPKSV